MTNMATFEITAEMNLKKIIAESREVAQALNEFSDNLERIEKKYRENNKENVCRGRRLSDEESQAALTMEQIEQQKAIRDMEKYFLDKEVKE